MFFSFAALARLPLAEVTAISFASPLVTVALAALMLHERVRIYRWSAVGVGFIGVIVMLAPHLYFSLVCAAGGLLTLPFGWVMPTPWELGALIATGVLGGTAHLVLTHSYRYAPASVIAPYDYTSILFAFLLGYLVFGEVPTSLVISGSAIVVAAGLFVLWRERQLGLKRARDAEGPPSGA
jgi:drug/metabolite transporter (DMT)-like permease